MRILLYIAVLILAAGCSCGGGRACPALDEASALMQTDPGAALDRLNSLDVSMLEDSSDMARWALLYSEAMLVNRYAAPTDTIIGIAIDYYGSHGMSDELAHASRLKALMADTTGTDALATALYLQKEREFMLYRERMSRRHTVAAGILILLLAAVVIAWQHRRLRIRDMRCANLIAEASGLRADALRRSSEASGLRADALRCSSECSALEAKLSATLQSRFEVINGLCETYYESQGTGIERKAIAGQVKSQIESLKTDTGLFAAMEQAVNDCRGDVLRYARREWPSIKPDDYRLLVYLAGNLSNRTIALLIGESIDVVYKRKSRLKARISAMDLPHGRQILSIF